MSKKIFSDQSLSELKSTEKKYRSTVIIHTILLAISIGVSCYFTFEKGLSLLSGIPVLFLPLFMFSINNLKKVKDEIRVREKHIFLQNQNKEEEK